MYFIFLIFIVGKIMTKSMNEHVRLSICYAKPLTETIYGLVYANFPKLVTIV